MREREREREERKKKRGDRVVAPLYYLDFSVKKFRFLTALVLPEQKKTGSS